MERDCPNLHAQTHRNYAEGAHTHIQRLVVLNMEHILNVALTAHNHTSQPAGKCKEQTTMLATQNSCFLERDKWQETIESNSYEFIEGRTIVLGGNIPTPKCLHLCCFSQYPQVLESLTMFRMFRLHLKVALAPQPAFQKRLFTSRLITGSLAEGTFLCEQFGNARLPFSVGCGSLPQAIKIRYGMGPLKRTQCCSIA